MLEKILFSLRLDDSFEDEVNDLIEAFKSDLFISGIKKESIVDTDPLILQACKCYCKAVYTDDMKEAERYMQAYNLLKYHLAVCMEYKI